MDDDDSGDDFEDEWEDQDENESDNELELEEDERLRRGIFGPGEVEIVEGDPHRKGRDYTPVQWAKIKRFIPQRAWGVKTINFTDAIGSGPERQVTKFDLVSAIQLTAAWGMVLLGMGAFIIIVRVIAIVA